MIDRLSAPMDTHSSSSHGMTEAALSGPTIYPWDRGAAVAELQELLNAHGFKLRVDGDFGYITEAAVKEFQRQQGLRIDGVVGAKTQAALRSTIQCGSRELRRGHRGSDVCELQGLLQVCGYSVKRDGVFREETRQAVMAFQKEHKLREDGVVDAITWRVLRGKPLPPPPPKRTRWILNVRRWW